MNEILHVALPGDLATAESASAHGSGYRAASLDTQGFLHCCHRPQLAGVLERWFAPGLPLVLLVIDADALSEPPVIENSSDGDESFAHVYGAIPLEAVVARIAFVAPGPPPLPG